MTAADPTEDTRRSMIEAGVPEAILTEIQSVVEPADERLVWNTAQLQEDYTVQGFMAPYCLVTRKADGVKGTLMFTHSPRWYFTFEPTEGES